MKHISTKLQKKLTREAENNNNNNNGGYSENVCAFLKHAYHFVNLSLIYIFGPTSHF